MNIKRAKQEIKDAVQAYMMKDEYGEYQIPAIHQRPILLMGPPGIGKTQIMEQISRECEIGLVAYTITHHTRQSAIGLPFIQKKIYGGKEYSVTDVWNTKVCIQGWKKVTDTTIFQLIESYRGRIGHLMCTDITRDGMMDGTAIGLYRELLRLYPEIRLIASGGVSGTADLQQLAEVGVEAVVVGKALYEKKIDLKSLKNF